MRQVAMLALVSVATGAGAATLRVPEEYSSPQVAIDAAASGDTVLVGPGTWTGEVRSLNVCSNFLNKHSVLFLKPGLTIVATNGPESTILDGGEETVAAVETVLLSNADGPPTVLEGFTITGGGEGVTVGCTTSGVELRNCHIVDNVGLGMDVSDAMMTLRDCTVARNEGVDVLGSSFVGPGARFEAYGTLFEDNARGALRATDAGRFLLDGCDIVGHLSVSAVLILGCPNVTIRGCRFTGNATPGTNAGGGAVALVTSGATLEFNTFAYDSASVGFGGAVSVRQASTATIRNNTFYRCQAAFAGSALMVSGSTATVHNNVFVGGDGLGALAQSGATILPASGCNILWDNTSDYYQWDPDAAATDIPMDPEFCAEESLDFTVSTSSPALAQNSPICGAIGAHGQGCGAVTVESTSWGRLKSLYRESDNGR